ncbi:methyl-accepting chemotaxis protein [Lacrimispora sp. JR3]|uniref:methyl-accepting chemotaxis protein n=1 Tax=Lacrimispora sinapis TaxID=3111456 RepID=UPI00374A97C7
MKSIKFKLTVLFGILIIIVCVGLSTISYLNSLHALKENLKLFLPEIAEQTAGNIQGRIEGEIKVLEAIAARTDIQDPEIPLKEKLDILKEENKRLGGLRFGIVDLNGNLVNTDGSTADLTQYDFYKKALEGKTVVSDPVVTAEGDLVVPYVVPIKKDGKIVGVLLETRDGNYLSQLTNQAKIGKNGTAFMINKEQVSIADPDETLVREKYSGIEAAKKDPELKKVSEIQSHMTAGETGIGEFRYNKTDKFVGYAPVPGTEWSVGITMTKAEALAVLEQLEADDIKSSAIFVVVSLLVVYLIAGVFARALKSASRHLKHMEEGDLSREVPRKSLKLRDEIGEMANSMNAMQKSLGDIIGGIKKNSVDINTQSENLSTVMEEISSGSHNVSNMITEIAQGTSQQSENLAMINSILEEFSSRLSAMVRGIHVVDSNSREIGVMATDSNEEMKRLSQSVLNISSSFQEFFGKIQNLGKSMNQIHEITGFINSIAAQTNLLALNASIEASRAGEAGKGFSVIAEEVRRLAAQSKASSENISQVAEAIFAETESIVKNSTVMDEELNNQSQVVETALESYKKIIEGISQMLPMIDTIKTSAQDIERDKDTIIDKIEGIASASEEISSEAEEILASSEEISSSTEEVAAASQVLMAATGNMLKKAENFKV